MKESEDFNKPIIPEKREVKRELAPYEKEEKSFWSGKDYSKEYYKATKSGNNFIEFSK